MATTPQKKNVTSYGVICCRINNTSNHVETLLISKRYTYEYFEFVQGKKFTIGKKIPTNVIMSMLNKMTLDEKMDILSLNFDQMWYRIWLTENKHATYFQSKTKFEQIFLADDGEWLKSLISKSTNSDRIWEIPKGRKNKNEPDINCAVREFGEETNIEKKYYKIYPNLKRSYTFEDAGVIYTFTYFLAITRRVIRPQVDLKNMQQLIEINDIRWVDLNTIKILDTTGRLAPFLAPIFKMIKKIAFVH